MTTISARDPQISGKDSGKGDSDINDSDSDISDGNKKDCQPVNGEFLFNIQLTDRLKNCIYII